MTIEKLPSGSYRIRHQIDGKRYSVTVPFKPGKKAAYQMIQEKMNGTDMLRKTFRECAREYIEGKSNVLSPSTIRGYESILRAIPDDFASREIGTITSWDIQKYIDAVSKEKKPKTVRNHQGFISAVFAVFYPDLNIRTKLPQKEQQINYVPSDNDIKKILNMAKGSVYEIPLNLACYGLRRSEICALTIDDVKDCAVYINKAKVQTPNGDWTIKTTKTTSSTRVVPIDPDLYQLILNTGEIYKGYPSRIYWFLRKCQDELDIPRFPLHYLRHYFASASHALGIPDAVTEYGGGWSTDHIMRQTYTHPQDIETEQQKYVEHMKRLRG